MDMPVDGLDATTAAILSFVIDGNELLWRLGIEREASRMPVSILGHDFVVEATILDPWDAGRRMLIMRRAASACGAHRPSAAL
jgi:hypothetical protein